MAEVMSDPRREELAQRDRPEGRMLARERELFGRDRHRAQLGEALLTERVELGEEVVERLPLALGELGETVELLEPPIRSLRHDDARPRDPVGALAMAEVPDVVVRAPGVGALGGAD